MPQIDDNMKTYIAANSETRLHMYLQHPPLRDEFIKIDLGERTTPAMAKKTRKSISGGSSRSRWRTVMGNCCPRFRGS